MMQTFLLAAGVAVLTTAAAPLPAQNGARAVPFGVGERAEYDVTLGIFGDVGRGSMEVVGIEDVHGHPTYHLRFELEGGVAFAKVDDTLESWLDVAGLFTRRIHKDQDEVNYERNLWYEVFPDSMFYRNRATGDTARLASSEPLDEVAFLYWARTLPLEVGRTYTFNRYYKESGNPVQLRVLRKETLTGSGGSEIPVIVVQPIIKTSGLFGDGGEAEVYFTDDWRRILVKMTSKVPIIGRLGLTLTSYTPGRRLSAGDTP